MVATVNNDQKSNIKRGKMKDSNPSSVDPSLEQRGQELKQSTSVTGPGETSESGIGDQRDMKDDEFGVGGSDRASQSLEDIGGTDTEMNEAIDREDR